MKYSTGWRSVLLFTGIFCALNGLAATETPRPAISYDRKTDRLSVTATDAPYKDVMAYITTVSGIEILMDPKVEHRITIALRETPLETALKEISRQTSFILVYADAQPGTGDKKPDADKPMLIGMRVLPKGESKSDHLMPLLAPAGEAFIREKNRLAAPEREVEIFNHAQRRWEERLKKMPPEQREQLLEGAKEKIALIEKRQAERKQRKDAQDKKRQEREQKRQAIREELKATHPDMIEPPATARGENMFQGKVE